MAEHTNSKMQTALVIGASGGFGGAVARELLRRGVTTRALVRSGGRAPQIPGLELMEGDVRDRESVARAAEAVDVIVNGYNVPFGRWRHEVMAATTNVTAAAQRRGATILFPGNVFGLPGSASKYVEGDAPQPPSALGRFRNSLEERLRVASEEGCQVVVLRAGHFYGPAVESSWFPHLANKAIAGGAIIEASRRDDVPHAWAYMPDLARAGVALLERRGDLAPFEVFNFAGHELTASRFAAVLRETLGDRRRPVKPFPWWLLRLASPFWPMARHLLALRYLWDEAICLDDGKLRRTLGEAWRETPAEQAFAATVRATRGALGAAGAKVPGRRAA